MWRLCSTAGVFASHHRRKGKAGKPGPPVHDDLLAVVDEKGRVRHEFTATAPNQVWLTDITDPRDISWMQRSSSLIGRRDEVAQP